MRSIKKLYYILASVILLLGACVDPDNITPVKEAGVLISVSETSGRFLGIPDATGFFPLDVALDYELTIPNNLSEGVANYTIIKRYNTTVEQTDDEGVVSEVPFSTEWVAVETVEKLPYNLTYSTGDDFYNGLEISSSDLKVGDTFDFWVRINKDDGSVLYPADNYGLFSVTVNCLSDLAGSYVLDGLYSRASSGIVNDPYHNDNEIIYEVAPGQYITSTSGHWAPGDLAPGDDGFYFQDICGQITIEEQYLGGYWANILSGSGTVDGATGNIHLEYTVCYGGDCREYVADYVKSSKGVYFKDFVKVNSIDANNVK